MTKTKLRNEDLTVKIEELTATNTRSNSKSDKASCLKAAKNDDEAKTCMKASSDKAKACTESLLEPFFKRFPNSKPMQCNYDVPCENSSLTVHST